MRTLGDGEEIGGWVGAWQRQAVSRGGAGEGVGRGATRIGEGELGGTGGTGGADYDEEKADVKAEG